MAESSESGEDRTEAPTGRRLQRAREAGQAPVSNEAVLFAGLGAAALILAWTGPAATADFLTAMRPLLIHAAAGEVRTAAAVHLAFITAVQTAGPILIALLLAGVMSVMLQTGFLVSLALLRPRFDRINPVAGLRRLFGPNSLAEAIRSVAKLGFVGGLMWQITASDLRTMTANPFPNASVLAQTIGGVVLHLLTALVAAQAVIALLDVVWVRLRHTRSLRMSRHDIREEHKEAEGDPRIKQRIRRLRQARARRRMLAAVPKATVVVTNPTHYAVALAYDREKGGAPRVVAKGVDAMAERIRTVARANGVPLVPNPPLARALHQLELDTEIPAEYYKAVAEIIAFVWRLRSRAIGA